jgi:hypothetical protein
LESKAPIIEKGIETKKVKSVTDKDNQCASEEKLITELALFSMFSNLVISIFHATDHEALTLLMTGSNMCLKSFGFVLISFGTAII